MEQYGQRRKGRQTPVANPAPLPAKEEPVARDEAARAPSAADLPGAGAGPVAGEAAESVEGSPRTLRKVLGGRSRQSRAESLPPGPVAKSLPPDLDAVAVPAPGGSDGAAASRPVPYDEEADFAEEAPDASGASHVPAAASREPRPMPAGVQVAEDPLSGYSLLLSRKRRFARAIFHLTMAAFRLVATTLLVLGITAVASYLILREYVSGEVVQVPNVCGATLSEALEKLQGPDLHLKLEKYEFSDSVPAGRIITQYPPTMMNVKGGTPVRVVVSSGASKILTPYLLGRTVESAEGSLKDKELEIGSRSQVFSSVPAGQIVAQDPPPNTPVMSGSRVSVLMSLGAAPGS
jgi:hypothetical protein